MKIWSCGMMFFLYLHVTAQDSLAVLKKDTVIVLQDSSIVNTKILPYHGNSFFPYSKKKQKLVAYSQVVAYAANFASLYYFWYKDYPSDNFHFFDDNGEYLQVDKASHFYATYLFGNINMQMWKWAGASKKKYIWLGATSGLAYETVIEVMDGFSKKWGFSWGDYIANIGGTSLLVGQELLWNEQRILVKYSTHHETYSNPDLERFAARIYGKKVVDRMFKNYNPQTYWLSANLKSFFKKSNLPDWLNIAVGYGAENIIGAYHNATLDINGVETLADDIYPRYRQWYLAPDIDLTKIKTKNKLLKTALFLLNSFKFPTPSLELSQGSLKWNWIHI
jgi:hypothetical protein